MICQQHGGKGVNVSTSVWKFWGGGGALLLTPSWFLLFIPVAAAFFQSESAGVGSNSVCKCVQSGKSHVSILLLGKTIHKNILMLVSRVAS